MSAGLQDAFPDATRQASDLIPGENKPKAATEHNMPICPAGEAKATAHACEGDATLALQDLNRSGVGGYA
jgi:hypothetical protein